MKRILIPLGLVVGSAAAAVLLFEFVLRAIGFSAPIWYRPDPQLGSSLRPQVEGWYVAEGRAYVRVNSAGLRDREHSIDKPEGVYRIAVLGDSYAEAMQVDIEDTFWWLLQEKLTRCAYQPGKRVEVINFGVSGFGTAQEYLMLESVAIRYRPDLVLLQFTDGNDVRNNSIALEPEKRRPFFRFDQRGELVLDASFVATAEFQRRTSAVLELRRSLSDYSRVLQLLYAFRNAELFPRASAGDGLLEAGLDSAVLTPPHDPSWKDAWAVTERLIAKTNEYAKRNGSQLVVVTVPIQIQIHPDRQVRQTLQMKLGVPDLFYPDRRIDEFTKKQGIRAIPLAYEMLQQAERSWVYFHGFEKTRMGIGHWNQSGHRAAAEIIARNLCADQ
jgi:hypothetical protein